MHWQTIIGLFVGPGRESENDGTTLPLVVVIGAKIDFHILVPVGSMRPALIAVQDYLVSIYKHVWGQNPTFFRKTTVGQNRSAVAAEG